MARVAETVIKRVGVDFDNTLANYDVVLHRLATERNLIPQGTPKSKKSIRDLVRRLERGEEKWQRLQAEIYGPSIGLASLFPGALDCLRQWAERGVRVHVISHKTRLAGYDTTGTDLRQAALGWMEAQGLFRAAVGLSPQRVHFHATRQAKIQCIADLGCQAFIDDLEETFVEPDFPPGVERILFLPHSGGESSEDLRVARAWNEIDGVLFGA